MQFRFKQSIQNRTIIRSTVLSGAVCVAVMPLSALHAQTEVVVRDFSGNLADIIPSLYGADGIMLEGSGAFSHAAHFMADSLEQFNQLSLSVRDLSFPVLNPHIGVRFKYDSVLDEFVPTSQSISASAFAFDAETIGSGEFHIGVAYSTRRFDELSGRPLNAISVDLTHMDIGNNGPDLPCIGGPADACYAFERDVVRLAIDLDIQEEMFAVTGAYGLTNRLDLSLYMPLLHTDVTVSSIASIVENPTRQFFPESVHLFGGGSDEPVDTVRGRKTGLGDAVLRLNYSLDEHLGNGWNFNAGIDFRLPTGRVDNFQGLPNIGLKPRLIASRDIDLGFGTLKPHINVAYGFNAGLQQEQILDYALGTSLIFTWNDSQSVIAVGADFLGRNVTKTQDQIGDNQYDVSIGTKLHLLQSVNLYYNILLPLNDSGLRPNAQHVFGLQLQF